MSIKVAFKKLTGKTVSGKTKPGTVVLVNDVIVCKIKQTGKRKNDEREYAVVAFDAVNRRETNVYTGFIKVTDIKNAFLMRSMSALPKEFRAFEPLFSEDGFVAIREAVNDLADTAIVPTVR